MIQKEVQLVIMDPGLDSQSGHHAETFEMIHHFSLKRQIPFIYFCSSSLAGTSFAISNEGNLSPVLKTDHYSYLHGANFLAQFNEYTLALAGEYVDAFASTALANSGHSVIFLFHSIDFPHAMAITFFLKWLEKYYPQLDYKILVLSLYNPHSFFHVKLRNARLKELYSRLSYKTLSNHSKVMLFAADQEIADEIPKFLDQSYQLPLHPCLLRQGAKNAVRETLYRSERKGVIILYLGDAKSEKGFTALPYLLEKLSHNKSYKNYRYLVQYTLFKTEGELAFTEQKLQMIAAENPAIQLVKGYVDAQEIDAWLATAEMLILNYDKKCYDYKSSGILWLAARLSTPVVFLQENWLSREAVRLGVSFLKCGINDLDTLLENHSMGFNKNSECEIRPPYYKKLFSSFEDWLEMNMTEIQK